MIAVCTNSEIKENTLHHIWRGHLHGVGVSRLIGSGRENHSVFRHS